MKWEYTVIFDEREIPLIDVLNGLGEKGWELVTAVHKALNGTTMYTLKRPLV